MAGTTIHRILGLLVLLGLSLMFAAAAHAGEAQQDTNALSALSDAPPSWVITTQTGAQEKPACLHVLEHSHESCRACGTSLVLISTGRLRAKFLVNRSKPNNSFLRDIQLYATAVAVKALPRLTYGSLSQALSAGADIFARTGRLRI